MCARACLTLPKIKKKWIDEEKQNQSFSSFFFRFLFPSSVYFILSHTHTFNDMPDIPLRFVCFFFFFSLFSSIDMDSFTIRRELHEICFYVKNCNLIRWRHDLPTRNICQKWSFLFSLSLSWWKEGGERDEKSTNVRCCYCCSCFSSSLKHIYLFIFRVNWSIFSVEFFSSSQRTKWKRKCFHFLVFRRRWKIFRAEKPINWNFNY